MRASVFLLSFSLTACGDNTKIPADAPPFRDTPTSGTNIYLRQIATIDGTITLVASPPNDARLFVVHDAGRIWIIDHGQVLPDPFLDIRAGMVPPYVGGSGQDR